MVRLPPASDYPNRFATLINAGAKIAPLRGAISLPPGEGIAPTAKKIPTQVRVWGNLLPANNRESLSNPENSPSKNHIHHNSIHVPDALRCPDKLLHENWEPIKCLLKDPGSLFFPYNSSFSALIKNRYGDYIPLINRIITPIIDNVKGDET